MFCPNCASEHVPPQHYCRTCGLKLDAIVANVAEQRPSQEITNLLKRKRRFERLGTLSLAIAGVIGAFMVLGAVLYYKLQVLGPDLLFGSASVALVAFTLLAGLLLSYPKWFLRADNMQQISSGTAHSGPEKVTTNKLIADPDFSPASVTEQSTELLKTPR